MSDYDPIPTLTPREFLLTMFSNVPDGWLEVCYLAPEDVRLYPHTVINWVPLPLVDVDPDMPGVMKYNRKGYSCYFGCAARGRTYEPEMRVSEKTGKEYRVYPRGKAHDATYITALWVDVDEPGEPGYLQTIGKLTAPPSIVVHTGGGWHGYWLLTEPLAVTDDNREDVKRTLKGMALACGSDTKVADLARIMRLPGTVNTKPNRNNTLCEVVDYFPARFHFEDFWLTYAPLAAPVEPHVNRNVPMAASGGLAQWVSDYLEGGAPVGERNARLYAVARSLFDNGYSSFDVENMAGNRARADGLPEEEITATITSAERAPRGTPNIDRQVSGRMAAADRLLRVKS